MLKQCEKYSNTTLVDVEKETLGIDVDKLDRYLKKICIKKGSYFFNKKTNKKITAVIPTHLYGSISNMGGLKSLAKKYNLELIEDAAEAIGADLNGIYAEPWQNGSVKL